MLPILSDNIAGKGLYMRIYCEMLKPSIDHFEAFFEYYKGNRLIAKIGLSGGFGR